MEIRIHSIEPVSLVDGPGARTVVFLQGCPIGCRGCQNTKLWPAAGGQLMQVDALAGTLARLADGHGQITISGGEPFAQPAALAELVFSLKVRYQVRSIMVYSGYTWEALHSPEHPAQPFVALILGYLDTLVDGPFIVEQDNPYINYRGSLNQRPIDVPASLASGELVVRDWDSAVEITITADGRAVMPIGMAPEFSQLGQVNPTRRCGERSPKKGG